MRNKILFIALSYGHDNYLSNHKLELSKYTEVISFSVDDKNRFISKVYKRRGFLTIPIEFLYFIYLLIKEKPSNVVTVGPKLGLLLSLTCTLFPKIKHGHWFTGQVWGASKSYRKSLAYWCDVVIINLSDNLFSDGLAQRSFLKEKINILKPIHVPRYGSVNGVSDKFFLKSSRSSALPSRPLRICFIGRKALGKGLERIPIIAKELSDLGISAEFVLAGPVDITFPNYESWKSTHCNLISSIKFIDDFVDPVEVFKDSHALILPSDREGFGSVVIEAQASGLVVLCSDIYGLKDSFIDGKTGFSCKNNDLNTYVEAIVKLSEPEVINMMSLSALSFANNFKSDKFRKELYNCYKNAGYIL